MTNLKKIRISKNLTQKQACSLLGISLRSYITYETDESKVSSMKYCYMVEFLQKINQIDEEHGILTIEDIIKKCRPVLDKYNVKYVILFGSYAKGIAKETSDVDLLISTDVTGLSFFGIIEDLREALQKKVDLLDLKQLNNNPILLDDILREGIKVYEQPKK